MMYSMSYRLTIDMIFVGMIPFEDNDKVTEYNSLYSLTLLHLTLLSRLFLLVYASNRHGYESTYDDHLCRDHYLNLVKCAYYQS